MAEDEDDEITVIERRLDGCYLLPNAAVPVNREDVWADLQVRQLWVYKSELQPWPQLLSSAPQQKTAPARTSTGFLLLGYDKAAYEAMVREKENQQRALAKKSEPPPRRDVYVKGAQDWERNAWKVWDKKKVAEDKRRDRYGQAITCYLGGSKIVVRQEPPALTQCAHCDIGGGIHPLRRCMGCFAVAYCCRLHQKVHWMWHKHICFAIRAANNLEAKKGEGAGWVKLRPRRWRRPPIEKGTVVEMNTRMRWANWKQFYTNGAQPMLNMMGDGGPLVCRAWDEAVASMAMCEEATFVFGVKEVQRMQMPFVAARKAPMGTVLVIEVGLIDVKRDNGKRREVNDFLWVKTKAERRQEKVDKLEEQKLMRLREKRDRMERTDSVMQLLKCANETKTDELGKQKDENPVAAVDGDKEVATEDKEEEKEVWDEEGEIDYEGFGEDDDVMAFLPPVDDEQETVCEPLNVPLEANTAYSLDANGDLPQHMKLPPNALDVKPAAAKPTTSAYDPWAAVDSVHTSDPRALQKTTVAEPKPVTLRPNQPVAPKPNTCVVKPSVMKKLLEDIGLGAQWPRFEEKGMLETQVLKALALSDPVALQKQLAAVGLKVGQRQKVLNALVNSA